MFSRFILLPLAAIIALTVAVPQPHNARGGRSSCTGGSIYCCNQKLSGMTPVVGTLGGLLTGLGVNGGLECNPITALGLGGATACEEVKTACCTGREDGLVNFECYEDAVA